MNGLNDKMNPDLKTKKLNYPDKKKALIVDDETDICYLLSHILKPKGNGLGLTNTQNIILSHRGKISIQSKPGKGSVFTVILKIGE